MFCIKESLGFEVVVNMIKVGLIVIK